MSLYERACWLFNHQANHLTLCRIMCYLLDTMRHTQSTQRSNTLNQLLLEQIDAGGLGWPFTLQHHVRCLEVWRHDRRLCREGCEVSICPTSWSNTIMTPSMSINHVTLSKYTCRATFWAWFVYGCVSKYPMVLYHVNHVYICVMCMCIYIH